MDRRSFLKLGALLPIAKSVIDKLIADRELALDDVVDWHDPVIIGGPLPLSEPIFAPDPYRIGALEIVSNPHLFNLDGSVILDTGDPVWDEYWKREALLARMKECDCCTGLDIQIRTGHCDS